MIGNRSWMAGMVLLGSLGLQTSAWAQDLSLPPLETGVSIDLSTQQQVSDSLVILCEGFRCEGFRRDVRVQVRSGDTLESLQDRLVNAMRAEVDRVFSASGPSPERVIIHGYVFIGTSSFIDREVPLLTMFVPRHRWLVGRYGVEQDGIYYGELVESQLSGLLPAGAEAPLGAGDEELSLPELPPLEESGASENGGDAEVSAPLPGQIQRQPITP